MGINLKFVLPTSGVLATAGFGSYYLHRDNQELQRQLNQKDIEAVEMKKEREMDNLKIEHKDEKNKLLEKNEAQTRDLFQKDMELLKKDNEMALMRKDREMDQLRNKHAIEKLELLEENKEQAKEINVLKNKLKEQKIPLIEKDNLEEEPIY